MRPGTPATAAAILLLAGFAVPADAGRALRLTAAGDLDSTTGAIASGAFDVRASISSRGRERVRLRIGARDLDVTRDAAGRLPRFDAFFVPAGGGADVLLGRLRVNGRGRAWLRVRRLDRVLDGLGIDVRAQAGATFEVRGPAGTVLDGTLPGFGVAGAGRSTRSARVYGRFVALVAPFSSPGSFVFRTDEYASGEIRNRLLVRAPGLLTGPSPPTYAVRVVNAASNRFVELGRMSPEPSTGAHLRLDSRRFALPGGIVRWNEFSGGRIEVRIGGSVRLRGHIAPIGYVGDVLEPVGWARAAASVELEPTAGAGVGLLEAAVEVLPNRRKQLLCVRIAGLAASGGPYTVVATAPSGTRTTLGTMNTRGVAQIGTLLLDTRRRDRIRGGGVVRLGGQDVTVLDRSGTTVLTATFPVLGSP